MTYTEMKTLSTDELRYDIERITEQLHECSTEAQATEMGLYISHAKSIIKNRESIKN